MKFNIDKEKLKNAVLKGIIPFNILVIIAGSSAGAYLYKNRNKEVYFPVSDDNLRPTITLCGYNKVSSSSVAKQIEQKASDDTVYMFKKKSEDKNTYEPVFVSKTGQEVTVTIPDITVSGFDGFNYGKVMINNGWYDLDTLEVKEITVDPISTSELEQYYDFYLDYASYKDDFTNSYSNAPSYVLKEK